MNKQLMSLFFCSLFFQETLQRRVIQGSQTLLLSSGVPGQCPILHYDSYAMGTIRWKPNMIDNWSTTLNDEVIVYNKIMYGTWVQSSRNERARVHVPVLCNLRVHVVWSFCSCCDNVIILSLVIVFAACC